MNDKITLIQSCVNCGKHTAIVITTEQKERLQKRFETGEHIQDILSELPPDQRELFISGFCGDCWDEIFEGFE